MRNIKKKQSKIYKKTYGINFIPKHLTHEEVQSVLRIKRIIKINKSGSKVEIEKDDSVSDEDMIFYAKNFFPSPQAKEYWAIIYDCTPDVLD